MPNEPVFEASQIKMNLNRSTIDELENSLKQFDERSRKKYSNFTNSLKKLNELTEKYYSPDDNGNFLVLNENDKKELSVAYEDAIRKAREVEDAPANDKRVKNFKEIAGVLRPMLEADKDAVNYALQENSTMTLPELIYKGRSLALHVSNASGQMNSRMIMNVSKYNAAEGRNSGRGYFTKEKPLNLENDYKELCEDLRKRFPEKFYNLINYIEKSKNKEKFVTDKQVGSPLIESDPLLGDDNTKNAKKDPDSALKKYFDICWKVLVDDQEKEEVTTQLKDLRNEKEFWDFQDAVHKGLSSILSRHLMLSEKSFHVDSLRIEENSKIAVRNVAMYEMAKLFGVPELIAKAQPASIMQDKKEIKGVLMDEVKGLNHNSATEEDIKNFDDNTFRNGRILKQLADLQALDWICGNNDRNPGNFIMQFDKPGQKDAKITAIVGIDNDNSFSPNDSSLLSGANLIPPRRMVVVSRSFYEKLKEVTKEQFNQIISGLGLSQNEVDAAWERKTSLQALITEPEVSKPNQDPPALKYRKIVVIEDDQWEKVSFANLAQLQHDGLFNDMYNMNQLLHMSATKWQKEDQAAESKKQRILDELRGEPLPVAPQKENKLSAFVTGTALTYPKDPDTLRLVLPDIASIKPTIQSSTRYPISYTEKDDNNQIRTVEGFYTKPAVISVNARIGSILDEKAKKNPKYKAVWKKLKDHFRINGSRNAESTKEMCRNVRNTLNSVNNQNIDGRQFGINDSDLIDENGKFKDITFKSEFFEAVDEIKTELNKIYTKLANGRDLNEREDLRNVAMSDVAEVLNRPKLLAKSKKVQVLWDGQIMEGVFMEKAKGEDPSHINKNNGFANLTEENSYDAFNNEEGLKSLADLQVIDYICNNINRHYKNMVYQFDKSNPSAPKLIGVQGIDNDMSFGTNENSTHTNVTVITETMKARILDDSLKNDIEEKLKNSNLSERQKEAVINRIRKLRENVENKTIKSVSDGQWGKGDYTFENLKKTGIFKEAEQARQEALKKKFVNDQPITFTKAAKVQSFGMNAEEKKEFEELSIEAEKKFNEQMEKIFTDAQAGEREEWANLTHSEFINRVREKYQTCKAALISADPSFHFSSFQYRKVKNTMNELLDSLNAISDKMARDGKQEMSKDEIMLLNKRFEKLSNAVTAYHNKRRLEQGSTLSKAKYKACDAIRENMSDFRYGLQILYYKDQITDKNTAMKYMNTALSKTALYAAAETRTDVLRKYAAQQIYIKAVQKSDYKDVKNSDQLVKALEPDTMRKGINEIMKSTAFRQLTLSMSVTQMKKMCREPDKLFAEYIRSMVKEEKLNRKQENEQNQPFPQNAHTNAPRIL